MSRLTRSYAQVVDFAQINDNTSFNPLSSAKSKWLLSMHIFKYNHQILDSRKYISHDSKDRIQNNNYNLRFHD